MVERLRGESIRITHAGDRFSASFGPYSLSTLLGDMALTSTCLISWRDTADYMSHSDVPANWKTTWVDDQVIEVGAGLSEFVTAYAQIARHPPIVIDPVDYRAVGYLFDAVLAAQPAVLSPGETETILTMKDRLRIYTNPAKITHIRMTLEDAYRHHPELAGAADHVIDVCAARTYASELRRTAWLESYYLLKPERRGNLWEGNGAGAASQTLQQPHDRWKP